MSMLQFFESLTATNTAGLQFADLLQMLTAPIYNPTAAASQSTNQLAVHKQVCRVLHRMSLRFSGRKALKYFLLDIVENC